MKDIWKKIVLKPFFSIFFVLKKQASTNLGNASLNNNLLSVTWLIIYWIKYKMLRNEVYPKPHAYEADIPYISIAQTCVPDPHSAAFSPASLSLSLSQSEGYPQSYQAQMAIGTWETAHISQETFL